MKSLIHMFHENIHFILDYLEFHHKDLIIHWTNDLKKR